MNGVDLRLPPKPGDMSEPHIRLLICHTCRVIDELPDYEGPEQNDTLLQMAVEKHPGHKGNLAKCPLKVWMIPKLKEEVIKQLHQGSTGLDVLGTQHYATRMQFAEDALKCYGEHLRPKGGCPDFRSEKKRLLPNTKQDRKEVGLSIKDAPKIYLCDFCPVRMHVENKLNEQAGL